MSHQSNADPLICYYVHHHGSGHIMRAITIASAMPHSRICFMGSGLKQYARLIPPNISCLHLPLDIAEADEELPVAWKSDVPPALHYAPLGVEGMRERARILCEFFAEEYPLLLIVDVSVEVAMLARLAGIPVIIVRQHGNRTDPAHLTAYQSAEMLIAPYGESLADPSEADWLRDKTCYAGGFSRFSTANNSAIESKANEGPVTETNTAGNTPEIAILLGQGGTSIDTQFVDKLAGACPAYKFHLIGEPSGAGDKGDGAKTTVANVITHGKIDDPATLLKQCALVIGNAGHNTVMEMADLNKRFICIPEERPFEEQVQKATLLERSGYAKIVRPEELGRVDWQQEIQSMLQTAPDWSGVTSEGAVNRIAEAIRETLTRVFPK